MNCSENPKFFESTKGLNLTIEELSFLESIWEKCSMSQWTFVLKVMTRLNRAEREFHKQSCELELVKEDIKNMKY